VPAVAALHHRQHNQQQQLLLLASHLHCLLHGSFPPCLTPSRIAVQQHASLAQRCRCDQRLQGALLLLLLSDRQLPAGPALAHPYPPHQQQQQDPATQLPSQQLLLQLPMLPRLQLQLQQSSQQLCQHSVLAVACLAAWLLLLLAPVPAVGAVLRASAQWCFQG
jgi:hypothetical protein